MRIWGRDTLVNHEPLHIDGGNSSCRNLGLRPARLSIQTGHVDILRHCSLGSSIPGTPTEIAHFQFCLLNTKLTSLGVCRSVPTSSRRGSWVPARHSSNKYPTTMSILGREKKNITFFIWKLVGYLQSFHWQCLLSFSHPNMRCMSMYIYVNIFFNHRLCGM